MQKTLEGFKKVVSKSPTLCCSPNFLNSSKMRRSISPRRYCLALELNEPKKTSSSNSSSRTGNHNTSHQGVRSTDNIGKLSLTSGRERSKKPPTPKYSENLIGIRKLSPLAGQCKANVLVNHSSEGHHKPKNLKSKVLDLQNKIHSAFYGTSITAGATKENSGVENEKKHKKNSSINSNTRVPLTLKNLARPPIAKPRSNSSEKRKLPARYLRLDANQGSANKEQVSKVNHIQMDLKLLQETNSEFLMNDLQAAKQSRLHRESIKKNSILKQIEEEPWTWKTPEISPEKLKSVHFSNNV